MGYRDFESPGPLEFFTLNGDPLGWTDQELQQRMKSSHGQPVANAQELDWLLTESDNEPLLRLEYGRFTPQVHRPADT